MLTDSAAAPLARVQQLIVLYAGAHVSVADLLCDRRDPAAVAYRIIGQDLSVQQLTYGQLREESERFASALAELGVRQGDRVATLMGKSREYLVTLMAIWRTGAVHVPLFTAFAPPAIAFRLIGSKAKLVVCDPTQRGKLEPGDDIPRDAGWRVIVTGADDGVSLNFQSLSNAASRWPAPAVIGGDAPIIQIYTSGTTGRPKAVVVPAKALAAFQAYAEFALDLKQDDLYWCAADPGWAYGLYFGILATFTTGVPSLLLQGGFSAELTLEVLRSQGVTNFTAGPTVYRSLRASGITVNGNLGLRCASSAGEPLTPDVNEWAIGTLGVPVYDHYGQTEVGMVINNHHRAGLRRPLKTGSMGCVMPGWTALVLREDTDERAATNEVGRLALAFEESPLAWFNGYLDDPQKSAERFCGNGRWYLTGDLARVDEDGYFHFCSRDDDVILMAGYRIGPFDVESVMQSHPAVAECAVTAVPDQIRGEIMEAFVVLRDAAAASEDLVLELQNWVKRKYAAHAYPRAVHFTRALPKTPSGKTQRFLLRERLRAARAADQDARTNIPTARKLRQWVVLGKPPRILPLLPDELGETAVESTRRIRRAAGSPTPVTKDTIPELVATLLRHPDLYARVSEMSIQLQGNGVLSVRDRQLAILRTAWLCKAPYAWGEHVKHSRRAGFSSWEIECVTRGSSSPGWDEHERAVLRAVEELHEGAMISDSTWATLAQRLDEKQLFELPVLVGQFTTVAYFQNALQLRLAPGNLGLEAR